MKRVLCRMDHRGKSCPVRGVVSAMMSSQRLRRFQADSMSNYWVYGSSDCKLGDVDETFDADARVKGRVGIDPLCEVSHL